MGSVSSAWVAIAVFALYSALNYLDRQTLAALAPQLKTEFQLSNEDIGWLHAAFYVVYASVSPFAGLMLDRLGLTRGSVLMICVWSFAAAMTASSEGFRQLVACRMLLGAAEAGAIPAFGKAVATYLQPSDRALGLAVNQLGISAGMAAAPRVAGWIAQIYGWRVAFAVSGFMGFFWWPLWRFTERRCQPLAVPKGVRAPTPLEMIRDMRLWALIGGNILIMTVYGLWTNWTTVFLVQQYHLTQFEANERFAWVPPVFATLGAFFGGWLSGQWIRRGATVLRARSKAMLIGAAGVLTTGAVPFMPGPASATAMLSFSFFSCLAISSNMYALPQDLFGAQRAGFALATITAGYGFMIAAREPLLGLLVDNPDGFDTVCIVTACLPLLGWVLLRATALRNEAAA